MSKTNTPASPKKKGSAGKTFLSIVFFILILGCGYILAQSMCLGALGQISTGSEILEASSSSLLTGFLAKPLGFWCAACAVGVWFLLWIITTKRIASAIRGLGVACSLAALLQIIGGLLTLLLTCVFSVDSDLLEYKKVLPFLFAETCGDVVIFALSSMLIAALGIFICKIKKLPKKSKAKAEAAAFASEEEKIPAAVGASKEQLETKPAVQNDLVDDLAGVCHMCGEKNEKNVKFCGGCGAKLG